MKAFIDADACIGCALCTQVCPELFEMDGDKAVVKNDPVPEDLEENAQNTAEQCPVNAIRVE